METSVIRQIHRLGQMAVGDLRLEWMKLYGEPPRSRNRDFLFKRLAWRVQELAHGGLSEHAKQRLGELAADGFDRPTSPKRAALAADPASPRERRRDPRLPAAGTVISKTHRGRELRVTVHEDGLELDGTMYRSATALAKAITGSRSINGWLFLGLRERKR